jgi:hypothetical protein
MTTKSNISAPSDDHQDPGKPSASKRLLVKAAWVTPAIVAVTLPRSGYAANVSKGPKQDKPKANNGNHFGQLQK